MYHVERKQILVTGGAGFIGPHLCKKLVAAGQGCSVREIATAVEQATGRRIAVAECPRRAGDPAVLVANNSRASTVLGWQPARSSINEIVQDAVNWHRKTQQVNAA
jgi:UDP-glucose 4-epimerase